MAEVYIYIYIYNVANEKIFCQFRINLQDCFSFCLNMCYLQYNLTRCLKIRLVQFKRKRVFSNLFIGEICLEEKEAAKVGADESTLGVSTLKSNADMRGQPRPAGAWRYIRCLDRSRLRSFTTHQLFTSLGRAAPLICRLPFSLSVSYPAFPTQNSLAIASCN